MPIDTSVVSIGTDFKLGLNMFGLGQAHQIQFFRDKTWPNSCMLIFKAPLAYFLNRYTSINRGENTKFSTPLSPYIKKIMEALLWEFLFY